MNKKFNLLKKLAIFLAIIGLVAGTAVITIRLNSDSSSVTANPKQKRNLLSRAILIKVPDGYLLTLAKIKMVIRPILPKNYLEAAHTNKLI